jgi:hypothetical protein
MPIAGDNLSLGSLGYAVGANGGTTSTTCLAANGRGANTTTAMSDFTITGITQITGVTSINENTSTTICAAFSGECTLFHRISCGTTQARNFVWSKIFNAGSFNLSGNPFSDRTVQYSALSVTTNTNTCVQLRFADCFNTTATNYNTNIVKAITIIDVPA